MTGEKKKSVTNLAVGINIYIIAVVALSYYSPAYAYFGGAALLFYLSARSFLTPRSTLFLLFGIKLTFDAFWAIEPPGSSLTAFRLTELFIVPLLMVIFIGITSYRVKQKLFLVLPLLFIVWISLAMVLNGHDFDSGMIVRLSGSLFGLLIGLLFVKDKDSFDQIMLLVFISTVIPVLASLLQILSNYAGISMLYYKLETTREFRLSGLYFDPATTGMVNIISLITASYLLLTEKLSRRGTVVLILFMTVTYFINLVGGTRSILITSSVIFAMLLVVRFRKLAKIIPLFFIVFLLGKPYLDKVMTKTVTEMQEKIEVSQLLVDDQYGQMFTGRVSLWQSVWETYNEGSFIQMLFGSGINSNAHSSYFFLLLLIGVFGLFYYLFFNGLLILTVLRMREDPFLKYTALFSLFSLLSIGFAATTVSYTSFQWIVYLIAGSVINISIERRRSAGEINSIPGRQFPPLGRR